MSLNISQYSSLLVHYTINWEQWQNDIKDYVTLLKEWNTILSLVSVKDIETACISHIEDSLSLIPYIFDEMIVSQGKIWLDIGSGGGFPVIPILLTRKDIRAILIERKSKKAGFLQMLVSRYKLINTKVVCETFPQCLQRLDIKTKDIRILTSRGVEKPEMLAMFLTRWMGKGMKYLCQAPLIDEFFNDTSFKKDIIWDEFTSQNMRRGKLVIIERN